MAMKAASLRLAIWSFPFSPSDVAMGKVYEFSIYHLMQVSNPAFFPVKLKTVRTA